MVHATFTPVASLIFAVICFIVITTFILPQDDSVTTTTTPQSSSPPTTTENTSNTSDDSRDPNSKYDDRPTDAQRKAADAKELKKLKAFMATLKEKKWYKAIKSIDVAGSFATIHTDLIDDDSGEYVANEIAFYVKQCDGIDFVFVLDAWDNPIPTNE